MNSKNRVPFGKITRLAFCNEHVDPDLVTQILELHPTFSLKVGEKATRSWDGTEYTSHLGEWKLKFPNDSDGMQVEDQIEQWVTILSPKLSALIKLQNLGYRPYLDCPAQSENLSLYFEPSLLQRLSELKIGLSIWLHEPAEWQ